MDKITLVAGSFDGSRQDIVLESGYRTMNLPSVFRDAPEDIVSKHDSAVVTPLEKIVSYQVPDADWLGNGNANAMQDGPESYFENNRYIIHTPQPTETKPTVAASPRPNAAHSPSTNLPTEGRPGLIPVNASGHRLDIYFPAPNDTQWAEYTKRLKHKKPCNAFHIRKSCVTPNCVFDHTPLSAATLLCLKYFLLKLPCKRKGNCRRVDCYNGHLCQRRLCPGTRAKGCQFQDRSHGVDMEVVRWVEGSERFIEGKGEVKELTGSGSSGGSMESWPTMVGNLIDI